MTRAVLLYLPAALPAISRELAIIPWGRRRGRDPVTGGVTGVKQTCRRLKPVKPT